MRLLVLGVASFGLLSCANPAAWHGSTAFTEDERIKIESAHKWICDQTDTEWVPIVWDRSPDDRSALTIVRDAPPGAEGKYDNRTGLLYIRGGTRYVRGVAAHEFGHEFNFNHTKDGFMTLYVTTDDLKWPSDL